MWSKKNHIFTTSSQLKTHFNSTTHKKWLEILNCNRENIISDNTLLNQSILNLKIQNTDLSNIIEQKTTYIKNLHATIYDLQNEINRLTSSKDSTNNQSYNLLDIDI